MSSLHQPSLERREPCSGATKEKSCCYLNWEGTLSWKQGIFLPHWLVQACKKITHVHSGLSLEVADRPRFHEKIIEHFKSLFTVWGFLEEHCRILLNASMMSVDFPGNAGQVKAPDWVDSFIHNTAVAYVVISSASYSSAWTKLLHNWNGVISLFLAIYNRIYYWVDFILWNQHVLPICCLLIATLITNCVEDHVASANK